MTCLKLGVFAAMMVTSVASHAVPMIDVSNLGTNGSNTGTAVWSAETGQSFTVGIDGILSQIDLSLFKTAGTVGNDITFNLYNDTVTASLFTTTITLGSLPSPVVSGAISVDLSAANISVSAGDMFVIGLQRVLAPGAPPWVLWNGGSSYAGGSFRFGTNLGEMNGGDAGFQTWVDTAAVPEPGTIALFGLGLAGLGAMRKKANA